MRAVTVVPPAGLLLLLTGCVVAQPPLPVAPTTAVTTAPAQYCREYQATAIVAGRPQPVVGTACREPDGRWRIVGQEEVRGGAAPAAGTPVAVPAYPSYPVYPAYPYYYPAYSYPYAWPGPWWGPSLSLGFGFAFGGHGHGHHGGHGHHH